MENFTRRGLLLLGAGAASTLLPLEAEAAQGTVSMNIFSASFIFGVGGGEGALMFKGGRYPFKVGGVSFGATVGISDTQLVGRAYNLTSPGDLGGTYSAASAGIAIAGGGAVSQLSNGRGVVLALKGKQVGFKLSLAVNGLTITMV